MKFTITRQYINSLFNLVTKKETVNFKDIEIPEADKFIYSDLSCSTSPLPKPFSSFMNFFEKYYLMKNPNIPQTELYYLKNSWGNMTESYASGISLVESETIGNWKFIVYNRTNQNMYCKWSNGINENDKED